MCFFSLSSPFSLFFCLSPSLAYSKDFLAQNNFHSIMHTHNSTWKYGLRMSLLIHKHAQIALTTTTTTTKRSIGDNIRTYWYTCICHCITNNPKQRGIDRLHSIDSWHLPSTCTSFALFCQETVLFVAISCSYSYSFTYGSQLLNVLKSAYILRVCLADDYIFVFTWFHVYFYVDWIIVLSLLYRH